MVALQIKELKLFTKQLFLELHFDTLLLREAEIVTFNRFSIDGKVRKSYYSEDEREINHIEEYSRWNVIKPFCFSVIKGNKLPESFRIVFQLPTEAVEQFLRKRNLSMTKEQIQGLYLNVKYEDGTLYCITGVSLNQFTLDKSLEREWEDEVREFLKQNGIVFEEQ